MLLILRADLATRGRSKLSQLIHLSEHPFDLVALIGTGVARINESTTHNKHTGDADHDRTGPFPFDFALRQQVCERRAKAKGNSRINVTIK